MSDFDLRTLITLAHMTLSNDTSKIGKAIDIIYFLHKTIFLIHHIPRISTRVGSVGPEFPRHALGTHQMERLILVNIIPMLCFIPQQGITLLRLSKLTG